MDLEKIKANFNTYFVEVLKTQYVDFAGRATRTQFWMFNLFVFVIVFFIALIAALINLPILATLVSLAIVVPSIAMAVRRIRDLGISGWFILVSFVPFIGGLLVLVGYCLPTDYLKPYQPYVDKIMQKLKK